MEAFILAGVVGERSQPMSCAVKKGFLGRNNAWQALRRGHTALIGAYGGIWSELNKKTSNRVEVWGV